MNEKPIDPFSIVTVTRTPDNRSGVHGTTSISLPLACTDGGNKSQKSGRPIVIIAEAHSLIGHGLRAVLEREGGFEVIEEVNNWDRLEAAVRSASPDLALLAERLDAPVDPERVARLRDLSPKTRVVMSTSGPLPDVARISSHLNLDGLVRIQDPPATLVTALYAVLAGTWSLAPEPSLGSSEAANSPDRHSVTSGLANSNDRPKSGHTLTLRETEVLRHIAFGQSNKAIARHMGISIKTVEKHRGALMRKLDAHNAPELLMVARNLGWI